MNYIKIQTPCSEDWNAMQPNDRGAFCQSCAKNVIDLTRMSNTEIHSVLRENQHQSICTRIQNEQLDSLNLEFERWNKGTRVHMQRAMVASLLIVFGLTLFSCNDERQQDQIRTTQQKLTEIAHQTQNDVTSVEADERNVNEIEEITMLGEVTMGLPEVQVENVDEPIQVIENDQYELVHTMMGDIALIPIYRDFLEQITPIVEYDALGRQVPVSFSAKAFPNPAIEQSTIEIGVPREIDANIQLFSNQGQLIYTIHSGKIERGIFQSNVELTNLEPGIYLIAIQSKEFNETVRLVKL